MLRRVAAPLALACVASAQHDPSAAEYRKRQDMVKCTSCMAVSWTFAEILTIPEFQCDARSQFRNPTKRDRKRKTKRECMKSEMRREVILEEMCGKQRLKPYGLFAPERHGGFGEQDVSKKEIGAVDRPPVFRKRPEAVVEQQGEDKQALFMLQKMCHMFVDEFEDDLYYIMKTAKEGFESDLAKRHITQHICLVKTQQCKNQEELAGKWPVMQEYEEQYNFDKRQHDDLQTWLDAKDDVPKEEQNKMKNKLERESKKRVNKEHLEKEKKEREEKRKREAAAARMREYGREPKSEL